MTVWILSGGNERGTSYEWYSEKELDEVLPEIMEWLFDVYQLDKSYLTDI